MVDGWTVPGFTHVQELGGGACGRVMLALDDLTQTKVAIKYLDPRLNGDEAFLSRYRGVARRLSQLEDPNVVDFYELVESPQGTAIVMERVEGFGLRRMIATQGPTGPLAALAIISGTLLGLAAAHAKDIVHGTLRPSEILIDEDGNCRLVDFALASAGTEAQTAPAYAAPELWGGAPPGIATDLYAATAIFYECLTGRPPFTGRSQSAIAKAHREAPIPVEEVPGPLRDLIAKGLAKDPGDRPGSAADFLGAVEDAAVAAYGPAWLAQGRGRLTELAAETARQPEPAPSKGKAAVPKPAPPGPAKSGGRGRGRVLAAALAVLVIAGGTAGGVLLLGGKDGDPPVGPALNGTPEPAPPPSPADPAAAALLGKIEQATAQAPGAAFVYRRTGGGAATARGTFTLVPGGSPSYTMSVSGSGDTRRSTRAVLVGDTAYVMAGKTWRSVPADGRAPGYPALVAQARWASSVGNVTALLRASTTFERQGQIYKGTAAMDRLTADEAVGALYGHLSGATGAQQVAYALKLDRAGRPVHLWFRAQGTDKARAQVIQATYSTWGRKAAIAAPSAPR
ncbi:serine/threonine-protein kinase [Actinomadura viridis]|uniref:serine/threonine-protein kinase n=1 Tax=Actinomadura viridis TaxID=58110 RepID=UPI0036902E70